MTATRRNAIPRSSHTVAYRRYEVVNDSRRDSLDHGHALFIGLTFDDTDRSSTNVEFGLTKVVQCSEKDRVPNPAGVVRNAEDLRQPSLPRRVSLEEHSISEENEQFGFAHDRLCDFGIDELAANVARRKFAALRHVRESFGEVDEGLTAVGLVNQEDVEMGVGSIGGS